MIDKTGFLIDNTDILNILKQNATQPNDCNYSVNSGRFSASKITLTNYLQEGNTHLPHLSTHPNRANNKLWAQSEVAGRSVDCVCLRGERMSVYSQHGSALQVYTQALQPPGNRSSGGQPETHDVIRGEHGLPGLSEKMYKTQSQHRIGGVNCIYSRAAVVD